jgi:carbon storage regulator
MLVLSRKQGEDVIIANNIRLTVVAIEGKKVRLGITAPPTVSIVREEIRQKSVDGALSPGVGNSAGRTMPCEAAKVGSHSSKENT